MIKVSLVDHMGSDLTVVNAARVSFHKESNSLDAKDEALIKYLASHKHTTPFRHPQIQLRVEAPLFVVAQLKKHQVGFSWSEVSRRYVKDSPKFYLPDEIRSAPDGSIKQGSGGVHHKSDIYSKMLTDQYELALDMYNTLINDGVAPEIARIILPQAMMTEWIWTGSLYGFFDVYRQRIDSHAQIECQVVAELIRGVVKPLFPVSWEELRNSFINQ